MADGHVMARIGERYFVSPPPSEPRTLKAVAEILAESPEPQRTARYLKVAVNLISRDALRQLREIRLELLPGWLDADPPIFAFASFAPRARPFDWRFDEADVPVGPEPPAPYPEQARLRLFLRPPVPAVAAPADPGKPTSWGPGA